MFGTLKNALKSDWYENEENQIITIYTPSDTKKYQVFSVYHVKTEDYYITPNFSNEEFEKFIKTIKKRSVHDFNVEVNTSDKILTLSSCYNNKDKIVLHAVLIKNETIN